MRFLLHLTVILAATPGVVAPLLYQDVSLAWGRNYLLMVIAWTIVTVSHDVHDLKDLFA